MIQSVVHIALVVKDYDEAIAFYTKKLHFTLIEDTYQPEQDKRLHLAHLELQYYLQGLQNQNKNLLSETKQEEEFFYSLEQMTFGEIIMT
ncbi:MAG: glyoxalase family protein [Neobacillus sp.]|nr:glyoxalase family protein [Neobacillus sp.]